MFGRKRQDNDSINNNRFARDINEQRQQKDRFFAASPQSPLPHHERHTHFTGLSYFPPDLRFRIEAEVIPFAQPEIVRLATSTGELRPQVRYAELRFQIGDQTLHLAGFADPHEQYIHELFVPFRDATSGRESYGAGRYLEVAVHHHIGDEIKATLDFNLAYNPYCAYSPDYSCPIPPAENTLPIAIMAGERVYGKGH